MSLDRCPTCNHKVTHRSMSALSPRENEVVSLVVKGLSNDSVAEQLKVTNKTIKFHLTNIFKKLTIKSRSELIVLFYSN